MNFTATSPYFNSDIVNGQFLDVMINRPISGDPTDVYWEIPPVYNMRPDLLAHDLYNDSRLWWVFSQRNPNTLKDPLYDFVTGVSIFIPTQDNIRSSLGL
jgi:hypothetical protein